MARKRYIADVEPLDLRGLIGEVKNRVERVGIELEGGWDVIPPDAHYEGDGSVSVRGVKVKGEIVSPAMLPIHVDPWVRKMYPIAVNSSCGLHVHMSFARARHYSLLMEPRFQTTMVFYLKKWAVAEEFPENHHIWTRLDGGNQYCTNEFWPDMQAVKGRKIYDHEGVGHRYTIINYPHGLHETMECRVLPMMDTYEQACRAIHRVLDVTNAYLVARNRELPGKLVREKKVSEMFNLDAECGVTEEETREVVPLPTRRVSVVSPMMEVS